MTKFTVKTSLLKEALNLISPIIISKAHIPAATWVTLIGQNGVLTVTYFNLIDGLSIKIPLMDYDRAFEVALIASSLNKLVTLLETPELTAEIDDENYTFTIFTFSSKITLELLPFGESPSIPSLIEAKPLAIEVSVLTDLVNRVSATLGTSKGMAEALAFVHVKAEPGELSFYSSNGYGLSKATTPSSGNETFSTNISPKFLKLLCKIIKDFKLTNGELTIAVSDIACFSELTVETPDGEMTLIAIGRLNQNPYPPLDKIIPTECRHLFSVPTKQLLHALNIIDCLSTRTETAGVTLIELTVNPEEMILSYTGSGHQKTIQHLPLSEDSRVDGEVKIVLNAAYLKDHLNTLNKCSFVCLGMNYPNSPVMVQGKDNFLKEVGIVMPVMPN